MLNFKKKTLIELYHFCRTIYSNIFAMITQFRSSDGGISLQSVSPAVVVLLWTRRPLEKLHCRTQLHLAGRGAEQSRAEQSRADGWRRKDLSPDQGRGGEGRGCILRAQLHSGCWREAQHHLLQTHLTDKKKGQMEQDSLKFANFFFCFF